MGRDEFSFPKALSTLLFQLWDVNRPTISQAMSLLPDSCCWQSRTRRFAKPKYHYKIPNEFSFQKTTMPASLHKALAETSPVNG
jgi:hypothetical protein